MARIASTPCLQPFSAGVSPTQAASRACDFGIPSRVRLNFVRPPEAPATGSPVRFNASNRTRRVALTAAAAESGAFACASTLRETLGTACQEGLHRLRALGLVAGRAREGQVRDPVGAAPCLRTHVVDLQRRVRGTAIGARPSPLLEQAFPDLAAGEGALLVLRARDLRVLQRLGGRTGRPRTRWRSRARACAAAPSTRPRCRPATAARAGAFSRSAGSGTASSGSAGWPNAGVAGSCSVAASPF